jgi:hypothetical protein
VAVAAAGSAGLSAGVVLFLLLNKPFSLFFKSESALGAIANVVSAKALSEGGSCMNEMKGGCVTVNASRRGRGECGWGQGSR